MLLTWTWAKLCTEHSSLDCLYTIIPSVVILALLPATCTAIIPPWPTLPTRHLPSLSARSSLVDGYVWKKPIVILLPHTVLIWNLFSLFFLHNSVTPFLSNLYVHKQESHVSRWHISIFAASVFTPDILFAFLCSFMQFFPLHMSVKYPESTHTGSLLRTPPLAYGASEPGEIVGRRCLCRLDLNWRVLNSELQRMACGNEREEVKPQQYVAPIIH